MHTWTSYIIKILSLQIGYKKYISNINRDCAFFAVYQSIVKFECIDWCFLHFSVSVRIPVYIFSQTSSRWLASATVNFEGHMPCLNC